jgi:AcrR family transcriptional regulator
MVYTDTRRALLDAAAEVINRSGLEAASTREIYTLAGVKAPTLYHHFGDKQGLLDAVVTDAFDRYLASKRAPRGSADPAEVIRAWDRHVEFAAANPVLYRLMWPDPPAEQPPAAAQTVQSLRDGFARLGHDRLLRRGITPRQAARTLSAALIGVTAAIIRDPDDAGNQRLSATVRDAVIDALLIPAAGRPG